MKSAGSCFRVASLLVVLQFVVGGCATPRSTPLTEPKAGEIRDTIMALENAMNLAVDGLDCGKGMLSVGDRDPVFVSNGWAVRNKAALQAACEEMVAPRTGATFAIDSLSVHLLSPEAAYVVREGTYTINYRDSPSQTLHLIMTTVWELQDGEWKMVHLHESYPAPSSR